MPHYALWLGNPLGVVNFIGTELRKTPIQGTLCLLSPSMSALTVGNNMNPLSSQKSTAVERPSLAVVSAVDIDWKLLRRSYEPMLLLNLLDPVRGKHRASPSLC
jgi:hypothetical protein